MRAGIGNMTKGGGGCESEVGWAGIITRTGMIRDLAPDSLPCINNLENQRILRRALCP